jgi:lipoprotein Spr
MIRNLLTALTSIIILAGCGSMRPMGTASNKQAPSKQVNKPSTVEPKRTDIKFLDEITANPELTTTIPDAKAEKNESVTFATNTRTAETKSSPENLSALQLKYAQLLGTDPDQVQTTELLKSVDEWYGTRYQMGGTSKRGIDCSAFVQAVYLSAFALAIPRTAFEQFRFTNKISAVEMKEGDLVFFNTTGGVSHVGIYLKNNKFIHASSSKGVTVSDLFDPYYLKRFLGVGRIEKSLGTR